MTWERVTADEDASVVELGWSAIGTEGDGVCCCFVRQAWFRYLYSWTRRVLVLVAVLGPVLFALGAPAQAAATWRDTGSMRARRGGHTATLLPNRLVLVTGGYNVDSGYMASAELSAELYDPTTETWSVTGSMRVGRAYHTATLLPSGLVLVAGGTSGSSVVTASAELYDPETETWRDTGSMTTGRSGHTATLLPSGLVLVVGGKTGELYDPDTETWRNTGNMGIARVGHTAM